MSQLVQFGRMLVAPLTGMASWYNKTAQLHPLGTGMITTGLKTSAADVFAQKVVEGREDFDYTRHAAFCLFGFGYLGGFQYWLYNVKFTQWCGALTRTFGHRATAPIKTFLDQAVHHPLIYFPVFFSIKAGVSGQPLSSAVTKYRTEIWDSLKALWMVWVPAQLVNFAFVPKHLRIPYVAAVSFGWTVILSVMQGKFDAAIAQRSAAAAAAGEPAVLSAVQSAQAAAAAAAAPGSAAPAAPSQPSLLPLAAAAVVKHERAATAATHAPLVAAAATAAGLPPRGAGAAVEEA
ncbi:hypothetical protein D9Q98_007384 [Chlorella vulgaris]|uniref:Uncharacterized protein n=1 Tax=Chlorella vulgaris TaxID=3077 RepID=A0A9D4YVG2_CHLVU|nr:hypothetical protein D9Q98_007384 [Chlorella vulgaris]